jgi:hypothetical protein
MLTLDLKKEFKSLYSPSAKKVEFVDVPPLQFAMIDGEVAPGDVPASSPEFQDAVTALYGISYTLKFAFKLRKADPVDYPVMALEGLWWVDTPDFDVNDRTKTWFFTLMIMQPGIIDQEAFSAALAQLRKKKDSPACMKLRLQNFHEGLSIQMMHIGPYATEPLMIEKLRVFASEQGYCQQGKHHEIYMGDPRKTQPDKLKTILRFPVSKMKD